MANHAPPNSFTPVHRPSRRAFTRIELLVIIAVVLIAGIVIMPNFLPQKRKGGHPATCVRNLKQIGLAFKVFAGDNDDRYPWATTTGYAAGESNRVWIMFQAMSNELQTAKVLLCPQDITRANTLAENFELGRPNERSLVTHQNLAVSYFLSLSTDETRPQAILAGDRNLSVREDFPAFQTRPTRGPLQVSSNLVWSYHRTNRLHEPGNGNFLVGDGSVQQAGNHILQHQLALAVERYTDANHFIFPQ